MYIMDELHTTKHTLWLIQILIQKNEQNHEHRLNFSLSKKQQSTALTQTRHTAKDLLIWETNPTVL